MLVALFLACLPATKTDTGTTSDPEPTCGTLYGTNDPDCPLACEQESYCGLCMAAPDTSDTATDVVWACIPCGAAC